METILPFVVAAIIFGFQIYANFKKEQEKALKRNPSKKPSADEAKANIPRPNVRSKKGTVSTKKEPILSAPKVKSAYEAYMGPAEEVEEVARARAIHAAHQRAFKRLEPFEIADMENKSSYVDFDLRDAVIKAAILERPYK